MTQSREEALRAWVRSFRGWLTITLVLTSLRLLSDLMVFVIVVGIRHRWPDSERIFRDVASDLLGSACLAWVFRYPWGAWVVLFATDLVSSLATAFLILGVAISFHVEPPDWVFMPIMLVAPRVLSILAVLWWVRWDARRTASTST